MIAEGQAKPVFSLSEPSFSAHQAQAQGQLTRENHHTLLRVGGCDSTQKKNDETASHDPFTLLLKARRQLSCSSDSDLNNELLTQSLFEIRQKQTHKNLAKNKYKNQELETALSRVYWELATQAEDPETIWRFAQEMSTQPFPQRTHERIKLSQNLGFIHALETGPQHQAQMTFETALGELEELARTAKGEQVQAEALEALITYSPSSELRDWARSTLWHQLPQTVPARRLTELPSIKDWSLRGEAAFKARDYQLTLDAMRRLSPLSSQVENAFFADEPLSTSTPLDLQNDQVQRAALLIAISLMRLREHDDEAEIQLSRALLGPNRSTLSSAIYYQAHLLGRLQQWDESIQAFRQYLKVSPRGHLATESRYQIGRILHQATRYDEAIKAQRELLKSKPKDRPMYLWFLGWSYFRKGDCRGAIKVWQEIERNKNLVIGPKVRYWTARCQALQGNKRSALKTLKTLLREAPLGYYALLAVQLRADIKGHPFRWVNPLKSDRSRHWKAAKPSLPQRDFRSLNADQTTRDEAKKIQQALELVRGGEEGLARVISHDLCQGRSAQQIRSRIGTRGLKRLCDTLLFYTGDHGALWKRQAPKRIAWLSGIHKRKPAERVEAYPLAYYHLSVAAAQVEKISPWWLMAHMLQESRYRPEVVSYAQAIGLMQILGRTGKRIHDRIQWPKGPFFSDQLYDPALSIRYAAWYLHHLNEDLGHPLLAIGAYNGGPMRFADHQDEFKDQRFDVMVEELGAHESRNYLRKVTDHFVRYLALYASDAEWNEWTQRLAPPKFTPIPKRTVGF